MNRLISTTAVVLLLTACGSTTAQQAAIPQGTATDSATPSPTASASATPTATPTPAPAATRSAAATPKPTPKPAPLPMSASVRAVDFAFSPPSVTVGRGARVVFTNASSAYTHTFTDMGHFDSGNVAPGGTFGVTFRNAGTYAYMCSIHTYMRGTITVR